MLVHLFDRFYVVTKFIGDLKFSKLNYDNLCAYLDNKNTHSTETKKHLLDLMTFDLEEERPKRCEEHWLVGIVPFVVYYKRLIKSYNNMAENILENEINLNECRLLILFGIH